MSHVKSRGLKGSAARSRSENNFALCKPIISTCITLLMLTGSLFARAADIAVTVIDRGGHGVSEAVVTATPATGTVGLPALANPKTAVMDQRDVAFVPRVLVVAVGTSVDFPNNDAVSHQVYSFSAAKRFQLPLYRGHVHPPVVFDRPGLVVLGCNIHDLMVGYIYVTDAPYFGKTDSGGTLQLKSLPGGDYRIAIWSPFIADPPTALNRTVHVDGGESSTIRVQLSRALRAEPEPRPRRLDWWE